MKYLLLLISLNCFAEDMTEAQAKAKIQTLKENKVKTNKDLNDAKKAISVLSGSWAKVD
jgi:Ni/Co efflux regulator RcnB